ncbi:Putative Pol polyprotein, partial [Corvus brachyrhynchos]
FAFTVSTKNRSEPTKRYKWVVLHQGMKNSPTLCQLYVDWALRPIRRHYAEALIYHYMDDILIATAKEFPDKEMQWVREQLHETGLEIAPQKIQRSAPWKYLGWLISESQIRPQKIELNTEISTLRDAQRLLGDLQWVRRVEGITNANLAHFLPWLHGTNTAEPRECSPDQAAALAKVADKLR